MASSYGVDGNPNDYVKFDLQFLSKSEDSNYKNLFYKFKVVDREVNGTTFADRVNSNERRYDVSGIELMTYGSNNATEYAVNGTFKFTGYSQGYGPDASAKSTLASTVEYLETITLDVKHTFYRTKTSIVQRLPLKARVIRTSSIRYILPFRNGSSIHTENCNELRLNGTSTRLTISS